MSIILGILTSLLTSLGGTFRKKAADNSTLPNGLFVLSGPIIGIFIIYSIILITGSDKSIFTNLVIIGLLALAGIIDGIGAMLEAGVYKKTKISKILPYSSFDKLFIILIGFSLYYGNPGYTSIYTLVIAIITVIMIILFSIDFKKFKIEKIIGHYILVKLLYAISTVIIGGVLLTYTTIDVFSIMIFIYLIFHTVINYLLKKDFTQLLKQSKNFYKYRLSAGLFGWSGFILGFLIIESSGVLIASLLSFISIVFSVLSMKYILGDTPTKKQIILAILVVLLIGIGYSLK